MSDRIRVDTDLPGGGRGTVWVSLAWIVVRVGGEVCAAHHRWMTTDQAAGLASALAEAGTITAHADVR